MVVITRFRHNKGLSPTQAQQDSLKWPSDTPIKTRRITRLAGFFLISVPNLGRVQRVDFRKV